jgi:uncharacterized protein (DUF433 family)
MWIFPHPGGGKPLPYEENEEMAARSISPLIGYSFLMSRLERAEQLLSEMTRAEKAQVLQWVVQDLGDAFPGIESRPDVCGGDPCVVRTRIPVWLLVQARRLGTGEADLLRAYPTLRAEDLSNAWAYYRAHSEEVDRQIQENEAA